MIVTSQILKSKVLKKERRNLYVYTYVIHIVVSKDQRKQQHKFQKENEEKRETVGSHNNLHMFLVPMPQPSAITTPPCIRLSFGGGDRQVISTRVQACDI